MVRRRHCALPLLLALARALTGSAVSVSHDITDVQVTSSSDALQIRTVYGDDPCPGVEELRSSSGGLLVDSLVPAPDFSDGPVWPDLYVARPGTIRVCLCNGASCSQASDFAEDLGTFSVGGPTSVSGPGGATLEPSVGLPFGLELHGAGLGVSDKFLVMPRSEKACGNSAGVGPAGLAGGHLLFEGPLSTLSSHLLPNALSFSGLIAMTLTVKVMSYPSSTQDLIVFADSVDAGAVPFRGGAISEAFALRVDNELKIEAYIRGQDGPITCDVGLQIDTEVTLKTRILNGLHLLHAEGGGNPCVLGTLDLGGLDGLVQPGFGGGFDSDFDSGSVGISIVAPHVEVWVGGLAGVPADAELSHAVLQMQLEFGSEELIVAGWDLVEWGDSGFVDRQVEGVIFQSSYIWARTPIARGSGRITVLADVDKAIDCTDHYVALSLETTSHPETELRFGWMCGEKRIWAPGGWYASTPCSNTQLYQVSIVMDVDGTAYFEDDYCKPLVVDTGLAGVPGDDIFVLVGAASGTFKFLEVYVSEPLLVPPTLGQLSADNTTLAWSDLVLDYEAPQAYRVCWCQGLEGLEVLDGFSPGLPSCSDFTQFDVEAGTFAVGGWGLELQNGLVGAGPVSMAKDQTYQLKLAAVGGPQLLTNDRITIVHAMVSCGSSGAGTMDANAQVVENYRTETTISWSVAFSQSGTYRVCVCTLVGECRAHDFAVDAGMFEVAQLLAVLVTKADGTLDLEVLGTGMSLGDRVRMVDSSVVCGEEGANVSLVNDPSLLDGSGTAQGFGGNIYQMKWTGFSANPGTYRVCWCGGVGDLCQSAKAFGGFIGDIEVSSSPTTVTSTSATVTLTNTTVATATTTWSTPAPATTNTATAATDTVSMSAPATATTTNTTSWTVGTSATATSMSSRTATTTSTATPATATSTTSTITTFQNAATTDTTMSATFITATTTSTASTTTTYTYTTSTYTTSTATTSTATATTFIATTVTATDTTTTLLTSRVFLLVVDISVNESAVGSPMPSDPALFVGHEWAQSNQQVIAEVISKLTGRPVVDVHLNIYPSKRSTAGFQLHIVLSLPDTADVNDIVDAGVLQASLVGLLASGLPIFGTLRQMLTEANQAWPWGLAAVDLSLQSVGTIDPEYVMPTTTTFTSTITEKLADCETLPAVPSGATGVEQCVPAASGAKCNIFCPDGSVPDGVYSCQDGTFVLSTTPACVRPPCAAPTDLGAPVVLPNGTTLPAVGGTQRLDILSLDCSGLVSKSLCSPACADGYVFDASSGSTNLECGVDGKWTGNAECVLDENSETHRCTSGVPTFDGVDLPSTCEGLYHGQTCVPTCKEKGYEVQGATEFVCTHSELLSVPSNTIPKCEPASCQQEPVLLRVGNVSNCVGSPSGEVCDPPCQEGYKFYSGAVTCELGEWVVTGTCLINVTFATVQVVVAPGGYVELLFEVDPVLEQEALDMGLEFFNFDWVAKNFQLVLEVFAELLGISPATLLLELNSWTPGSSGSARLLSHTQTSNRALQETQPAGSGSFSLAATFHAKAQLEGVLEPTQVLQDMLDDVISFNNNVSGSQPGLVTGLSKGLANSGQAEPEGLYNATITSNGDPVYRPEIGLLEPKWFVGEWSPCECDHLPDGGSSEQTRTVACSVDHSASCGAEPQNQQGCTCPTPVPWVIIIVACSIAGLCCCAVCLCELRRFRRSVRTGRATLKDDQNLAVSYRVQKPRKDDPDGKIHVIWDVNEATAAMKDHGMIAEENPDMEPEDADVLARQAAREHRIEQLGTAQSMYKDGDHVEYFSNTNRCWVTGTVKVRRRIHESSAEPDVVYDVNTGQGKQWRCDVALDMIRPPFSSLDYLEIFTLRGGGSWQACALGESQPPAATTLGYTVVVDQDPPTTLEWVPAARLRRCWPENCPVDVYRGPLEGWVNAIVGQRQEILQHPDPLTRFSPTAIVDPDPSVVEENQRALAQRPSRQGTERSLSGILGRLRGHDGSPERTTERSFSGMLGRKLRGPDISWMRRRSSGSSGATATQTQMARRQLPKGAMPWVFVPIIEDPHGRATKADAAELVPSWLLRLRQTVTL